MSAKIGRNDPCPCGSGRKYKHCCGGTAAATRDTEEKGHAGAVERALDWLASRHRKAAGVAIETMLFGGLTEEERAKLQAQDDETWQQIQVNANEWLLAEATIDVGGKPTRVADLLLGAGGPLFTAEQRQWIKQLSERPLRLYDVTDVVPGRQMTICDSLETEAPPIVVTERTGSQESLVGARVGFRIMEVGDRRELSGTACPFSPLAGPRLVAAMREAIRTLGARADAAKLSSIVRRHWLAQYFAAAPIPTIVDAVTGEALLLITDHYRVKDWEALQQALTAEPDVEGDRATGWARLETKRDEQTRPIAGINPEEGTDRISVFYRTHGYADRGRPWFEALARGAVQFLSRELSDPKGALAHTSSMQRRKRDRAEPPLPPEVMAELMEKAIRQSYATWADEPIPALGGKTPRQAIGTPAGLERVKGLLRGYEASETQQARREGRRAISYAFLWKALGIAR